MFLLLLITFQYNVVAGVVYITCSGKSGSCTLEASFQKLNLETHRHHSLNKEQCVSILERSKDTPILIIDSFRDIISRKIASYFHNLPNHLNMKAKEIRERFKKEGLKFIDFLLKDFEKQIGIVETLPTHAGENPYHAFKCWKHFGYDCLEDGVFDFNKKYQLKKIGNLYFLNLRFININEWQQIIRSIELPFDLSRFELVSTNIGKHKWYKNIYKQFLDRFTLSQADFDTILSNNVDEMAHFYNAKELEDFMNKWKPHIRASK